jgi:RNA polymerase sigma-70 factor (ECF subfamily)
MEVQEAELIKACVDGSEEAWGKLYRLYCGRVRRIVAWSRWRFTDTEVEDHVQEVFMELIKALKNFRGESSLNTFLTRLAKNKCISALRRKTAQKRGREELICLEDRRGESDEPVVVAVDKCPTPEQAYLMREEMSTVTRAMERISEDCRKIIALRYFQERSYEEICQHLDLPLGTVCSRLKRCLAKLKDLMTPSEREVRRK